MTPRYELVLEAQPVEQGPTPARRLAQVLKTLLRRHGFRCLSAKELYDSTACAQARPDTTPQETHQ